MDGRSSAGPPWDSNRIQGGHAVIRSRARIRRAPSSVTSPNRTGAVCGSTASTDGPATSSPGRTATFVHRDLQNSTHVFLRHDALRRVLQPPYSGPYKVMSRSNKTFNLSVRGQQITVSADRVKPAYILEESRHGSMGPPTPAAVPTPTAVSAPAAGANSAPAQRTHCPLSGPLHQLSSLLRGGGFGGYPHAAASPLPAKACNKTAPSRAAVADRADWFARSDGRPPHYGDVSTNHRAGSQRWLQIKEYSIV